MADVKARPSAEGWQTVEVRGLVALLVLPAALAAASAWVTALALARAPRAWIDTAYRRFADFVLLVAGTRLEVEGREHLRAGQAYVVVPNHESDLDAMAVMAALAPWPLRAVAKEELIRIPIFGRALLATGNVRVLRADTAGDVGRIRAQMARRPSDVSIIFFAEGKRSRDGALHGFKKGAFATAIASGLPVLPVGTAGTRAVWPPETLWIRSGHVAVAIGAPISVEGLTLADRERLRDRAHAAVAAARARARARLRTLGVEPGGVD